MKKKQLLTLLLAGCLAVAPVSGIAYAEDNTETTTEAVTEAVTETQTETASETLAEASTETSTEAQTETENPETEATASETMVITTQEELEAAIAAAPDVEDLSAAAPTIINISGTIVVSSEIVIPSTKSIQIVGVSDATTIQRGDGMMNDMFITYGALYLTADTATGASLIVDGAFSDGSIAAGSIVYVHSNAKFGITDGVTLQNNRTTGTGAAIRNLGAAYLAGGTITNNVCDNGAVYSSETLYITGSPVIEANVKTDGITAANILLDGTGIIDFKNIPFHELYFSHIAGYEGLMVATAAESEALSYLVYEGADGLAFDAATGTLTAAAADEPQTEPETEQATEAQTEPETETQTESETEKATEEPTESETESESESETDVTLNDDTGDTTTALKVVCKAMQWTSATSIKLTLYSNLDGWYYTDWVEADGTTPTFDTSVDGTAIAAETSFDVYFSDIPESTTPDLYITIKTTDGEVHTYIFRVGNYSSFLSSRPSSETEAAAQEETETERQAIKAKVTDSTVTGLENPLAFYAGTYYSFTVTGAGTTNTDPGKGDTKWVPIYWSSYEEPTDSQKNSTWKIGSETEISEASTRTLYVFFQKYIFRNGAWVAKDTIKSVAYNYYTAAITHETETEAETDVYSSKYAETETETDIYSKKYADEVSTGDETPIGAMAAVCVASLALAVGILFRRRKINEEMNEDI